MNINKIKITKNGPYLVSGNISLEEMIIDLNTTGYIYKQGRKFEVSTAYALCRCGKSKNAPFCDGAHVATHFDGTLSPTMKPFKEDALKYYGKNLIMEDVEELCSLSRFCHSKKGNAWTLTEEANNAEDEKLAIKLACDCPSGRLVMYDKNTNQVIEPVYDPSIVILQDPLKGCSGPIWVRGDITIEDEHGNILEPRNRITLCRCGHSDNKPFCDAEHINVQFLDSILKEEKN